MPIRTINVKTIESARLGNGGVLLDGTDGASANADSFLVLDSSAAGSIDANEKIEYEQNTIAVSNIEQPTITQLEDSSRFDFISLENEDGKLLLDASASGVDVGDKVLYDDVIVNTNSFAESLFHFTYENLGNANTSIGTSETLMVFDTVLRNEIEGASLSSSTFTLPAGTYFMDAVFETGYTNTTQIRMLDTSTNEIIEESFLVYNNSGDTNSIPAFLRTTFSINSTRTFKFMGEAQTASNTHGQGYTAATDVNQNKYTDKTVCIWKIR